ncbi:hypothetical protein FRX31_007333 [Thalictrum thalictroides]|uniref:Uncharacterized protein n=1 Tax=Thalictrum thalictroides TaxID=46969 RepID=A0A7J6X033_THATH|nr:hypothetical protein FRX31_007333 [Thalictrum thalictroides]
MVEEGGGKRRIFAIGNYINQRLLRSYHDWLMAVLRRIPCDVGDRPMAVDFVDGCHVVLLWSFLSGSGSSVDTGVQHVLSVATGRKAPKCRVLLWMAAERLSPACRFKAYAVLGDDIVIADRAFEFAKRFFVREGTRDLSPVLGHVIMSKWTIGLALLRDKYNINKAYLPV